MARALAAALAAALLAVPSAGGAPGAETPRRGGTVVLTGVARETPCLNTFLACSEGVNRMLPHSIFSTVLPDAFREGPGGTFVPALVERDVKVTKKPPFTLTYRIRREARWSDGERVSAADFVFTHETSSSSRVEPDFSFADDLKHVVDVRALGERTVRVVLRSRFAGWRQLFPYVLPRHALAGADFGTVWNERIVDPRTGRPIGSGPFLVQRWDRGRGITLVRNPRYWGGRPAYLDRIVYRFCGDCANVTDEAIERLRQGELDLAHSLRVSAGQARVFRQLDGVAVRTGPGRVWEHLRFRLLPPGDPVLRDPLVRRAIAHAIDRTALVRELFPGIDDGVRSDSIAFSATSPYYQPNWRHFGYRPAESARLFKQAGCRLGRDGIHVCPGGRLSLRLFTTAGVAVREQAVRILTEQLRRAGVELDASYLPSGPLFEIGRKGDFDVALFSLSGTYDDGDKEGMLRCRSATSWTGYCQRLVDRDLDEASRVLDADLRAVVLNRIDARVALDVPVLPLFYHPQVGAARTNLRGYRVTGSENPFIGAENWWLARS